MDRPDIYDVRGREEFERHRIKTTIDRATRSINLGKKVSALKNQPGFTDYSDAIQGLRSDALNELASARDDINVRQLQGKAQALNDILALLIRPAQTIQHLEEIVVQAQNDLKELEKATPTPPPQPVQPETKK